MKANLDEVHQCISSAWKAVRRDYFDGLIWRESDLVASLYAHLRNRFKKTDYEDYCVFTEWAELPGLRSDLVITHTPKRKPYVAMEAKMATAVKSAARNDRRKLKLFKDRAGIKRGYFAYIWYTPSEKWREYEGIDIRTGKITYVTLENRKETKNILFTVSRSKRTRQWQKGFWGECKGWDDVKVGWEVLRY